MPVETPGSRSVRLPVNRHDTLFRALVSEPSRAASLLTDYLPRKVAELLDPEAPFEAVGESFVDKAARTTQCDALFRVRLKDGKDARLYVLLEHKSYVDAETPLQLLGYMVNIWRREIERSKSERSKSEGGGNDIKLPAIIPLVFYHGRGRWKAARSVLKMIDAPEKLKPFVREFAYVVHDLGEMAPDRPSTSPEVRSALLALRFAFAEEVPPDLLDVIMDGLLAGSDFEHHIVRYMTEHQGLTPAMLEASLRRTKPDHWEVLMGTIAQTWVEQGRSEGLERGRAEGIERGRAEGIERGRAEGIERGRAEGLERGLERGRSEALAELLLRQLSLRFGDVPDAVRERVRGASAAELEAWAEAVLAAPSLDDVLAARPRQR